MDVRPGASRRTRLRIYAVAVGLVVGAATSWAQTLLGSTARAGLANAVSPWLVAPFLAAARAAGRRSEGMLGILTCVAEVLGYYATAAVRDSGSTRRRWPSGSSEELLVGWSSDSPATPGGSAPAVSAVSAWRCSSPSGCARPW